MMWQTLSNRLAESIERQGGKILLRAPVTKILVEHGRTVGMEFDSHYLGRSTVRAPANSVTGHGLPDARWSGVLAASRIAGIRC